MIPGALDYLLCAFYLAVGVGLMAGLVWTGWSYWNRED